MIERRDRSFFKFGMTDMNLRESSWRMRSSVDNGDPVLWCSCHFFLKKKKNFALPFSCFDNGIRR